MSILFLTLLACIAPLALADVQFTSPPAGGSIKGGSTISVQWKDSGTLPAITDLKTYQLFLCAGGNDPSSFVSIQIQSCRKAANKVPRRDANTPPTLKIQLAPIQDQGDFSTGSTASKAIQASVGGSDTNA